ncbi:hypothetical protein [Sciscionella marina]|uniref:hypothetical protein n=1 Tax=Sciscionella marina TaxID=508770 RepID=UPI000381214F|nr:hypothetical protein [Sciscionella marina]
MSGFTEAVRAFTDEVDAALNRARKASSDAAERSEAFRAGQLAREEAAVQDGKRADGDAALCEQARDFRIGAGLPVPENGGETEPGEDENRAQGATGRTREPLGYDDEDFSQGRLMS